MLTNTRIVWGAILVSSVILFLVGSQIPVHSQKDLMSKLAVLGVGCVVAPIAGLIRVRREYRKMLRSLDLQVRDEPASREADGYRGVSLARKVIANADAPARVLRHYHMAVVFGLFFAELPAIFGFLARMIGGTAPVALAMTVISWIAIGTLAPTKKAAYGPVEDLYGAVIIDDPGAR